MIDGRPVICISTIEWDFSWQANQEIMSRLAQAGNPVLFVETTGVRNARLSDLPRMARRIVPSDSGARHARPENVTVYSPRVIPFPHNPVALGVNRRVVVRRVRRWLASVGAGRPVLWAFLPSPLTIELAEALDPAVLVYQYMGSMHEGRNDTKIQAADQALLEKADVVFANSLRLLERAQERAPESHLVRAGVNLERFDPNSGTVAPDDVADLRRPVIGYVGTLHEWVDFNILEKVARRLPEATVLLVGGTTRRMDALDGVENVRWVGPKPHEELARYVAIFDVGLIPYVQNAYTWSSFPGKLNEYLALGKPVVATRLPELEDFNREFDGVVDLADDPESFAAAVRAALDGDSAAGRTRRRSVAEANSWSSLMTRMAGIVERHLSSS